MFNMISAIDNRLREKSIKKSVISTIYRFYIDISWKYRVCGTRARFFSKVSEIYRDISAIYRDISAIYLNGQI